MGLREAKRALRRRVKGWRDALSAPERESLSGHLADRLLALECYRAAGTVLVYADFGSEVATGALVGAILQDGKRLVMPRVADGDLVLHAVVDPERDLVAGVWGIREPDPACNEVAPAEVELFLLPGLAFDEGGGRLGYGRGYFDRVLAQASGRRVALAFDGQVVEAVPRGATDVAMDLVVTPTRVIRCGPASGQRHEAGVEGAT
jgi:5-formyltetrahydrofolate cyclo-ligase